MQQKRSAAYGNSQLAVTQIRSGTESETKFKHYKIEAKAKGTGMKHERKERIKDMDKT